MQELIKRSLNRDEHERYIKCLSPRGFHNLVYDKMRWVSIPCERGIDPVNLLRMASPRSVTLASTGMVIPTVVETIDPDTFIRFNNPRLWMFEVVSYGRILYGCVILRTTRINNLCVMKVRLARADDDCGPRLGDDSHDSWNSAEVVPIYTADMNTRIF